METEEQKKLKKISVAAAKKIPYVGSVAGPLLDILWVVKEKSLWDQIKEQVAAYVEQKLVEQRLDALSAKLKGYASSLEYINTLEGKSQFNELKTLQLVIETDRYLFYDNSGGNSVRQTLPLFTPMAIIHVLVSNLVAGMGDTFEKSDANKTAYNNKYSSLKKEYAQYGETSSATATKWRSEQVEITYTSSTASYTGAPIPATIIKCYDRFTGKTIVNSKVTQLQAAEYKAESAKANNYKNEITNATRQYWQENVQDRMPGWKTPEPVYA